MRLVLLLFTAGRASADGFHAGDAWRGTMTNCQQSPHMLRRAVRYVAIELSVLAVDDRKVEVQFQNHAQKDMSYKLHGEYDPSQRRLHLRAAQTTGNFGNGWSPCDALAHLSADFSTLSGVALCHDLTGRACDHGGGEFVLRHDRAELVVEGAGDSRVNGRYTSKAAAAFLPDERKAVRATQSGKLQIYDGAPVFVQVCASCDEPFALVHAVIGQYGHWCLVRASSLGQAADDTGALYSVISEDVYPPEGGWRPVDAARGPPPAIRTSVRSLYADLPEHHRLQAGAAAKAEDARAHSVAILGACGLMLWALVYTLSTKVRLSPRGVNAVKKFFPSPRQAWLPRRGSFSLE